MTAIDYERAPDTFKAVPTGVMGKVKGVTMLTGGKTEAFCPQAGSLPRRRVQRLLMALLVVVALVQLLRLNMEIHSKSSWVYINTFNPESQSSVTDSGSQGSEARDSSAPKPTESTQPVNRHIVASLRRLEKLRRKLMERLARRYTFKAVESNPAKVVNAAPVQAKDTPSPARTTDELVEKISAGSIKKPAEKISAGNTKKPAEKISAGNTKKPAEKISAGNIEKPVQKINTGSIKKPVQKISAGNIEKPAEKINAGSIEKPVQKINAGNIKKPVQMINVGSIKKPVQKIHAGNIKKPVQMINVGSIKKPVQKIHAGNIKKPVQMINVGSIKKPVQKIHAGNIKKPVQMINAGSIKKPAQMINAGNIKKPVQMINAGSIKKPVQMINAGSIKKPVQMINVGSIKKPVQKTNAVNIKKPAEKISEGGIKTALVEPKKNYCPIVSPKLVGIVKLVLKPPGFVEQESLHPELQLGGHYKPTNCISYHKIAIIIPFRDREEHLAILLNHLHPILQRQQLDYTIFVVEQEGLGMLNRGMLKNIGVLEAIKRRRYTCLIFHDVDLLTENDMNPYTCFKQPRHMSVGVDTMKYKLIYNDLFGGVAAVEVAPFLKANGFSNLYWGWGAEDDDLTWRLRHEGYTIIRFSSILCRYTMLPHAKDSPNPSRYNFLNTVKSRYKKEGLNSIRYRLLDMQQHTLYTWLYVELFPS